MKVSSPIDGSTAGTRGGDMADTGEHDATPDHYEGTEKLLEVWFRPQEGLKGMEKCDLRNIPRGGDMADSGRHDVTPNHYEGTEKLLEVWFRPREGSKGPEKCDLRKIAREELTRLMRSVKCDIVSVMGDADQDAYILSESSMFVSKTRFILKTCGTTLLLEALEELFRLARKHCNYEVEDIFYSRKNFLRPELQENPHKNFEKEVEWLDKIFDCGAAYVLGRINGECWYLYTLDRSNSVQQPDQTLEILMTDLDPGIMKHFQDTKGKSGKEVTKVSGIDRILPEATINEVLFDPCGYSMNGLFPNNGYVTIHVTPQAEFSYVSFESNVEMEDYSELVQKVIETFKPGRFVMTLFANEFAKCGSSFQALKETFLDSYRRQEKQFSQFKNYDLTFGHYVKDRLPKPSSDGVS